MIFALFGALLIGLSLGVFGSGGSIITIPVLLYVLHHEDKVAIAESLGIVGAIAAVSAVPYARAGLVDWRTAILFGVPGMAGTYIGSWVAVFVAGYVQLLVFAVVMLCAAVMMWRRSRANPVAAATEQHQKRSLFAIGAQGLVIGVLTGFVGVGGGFLIVPALVLLGGLPMRNAVATSLVIITFNAASGFWKHVHSLEGLDLSVNWRTIGLFALVGGLGSLVGKHLSARLNQAALQRGFAIFLIFISIFIVVREGLTLIGPANDAARQVD